MLALCLIVYIIGNTDELNIDQRKESEYLFYFLLHNIKTNLMTKRFIYWVFMENLKTDNQNLSS